VLKCSFSCLKKLLRTFRTETNCRAKPKVTAIREILSGVLRKYAMNTLSEFILRINPENSTAKESKSYMLMMNVCFLKHIC